MTTHNLKRYMMPLFAFFIMFAGARAEGDTVRTWQWQVDYNNTFWGVQYSKTDKYIVALSASELYFLNPQNGEKIKTIKSRLKFIEGDDRSFYGRISFINNDSEFLYESEDRKTIDCYDANTFSIKYSLEAPGGEIIEYNVSRDEKQVVAKVNAKEVKVWDLKSKKIIATYTYPSYENEMVSMVKNPRFTPDGKKIIVGTYTKIKTGESSIPPYYYSKEYNNIVVFDTKLDSIGAWSIWDRFVWSKSGKLIASVNSGGSEWVVRVFDSENFNELYTIHTGAIGATGGFFFSDDEKYFVIAYGVFVDICKVFRLADGKNTVNYQTGSASGATISNSGKDIVFSNGGIIFKYAFSPTASIGNGYFDNGVISYPNPVKGGGVMKFNQEKPGNTKIYINDEKGSVIKEVCNTYFDEGPQAIAIDASDLANGVYFITVANDTQKFTEKIIVQR